MINTGYHVSRFPKIGYRNFSLNVTITESVPFNVNEVISNLENGNKDTIDSLEKLGLNYSLTEYQNGYKIKFEYEDNKYTVAFNGETTQVNDQSALTNVEVPNSLSLNNDNSQQTNDINPPIPPNTIDYLKEVTDENGMKETVVDEDAYNQAMQDYQVKRAEYNAKIQALNLQTAEQQKQDAITDMQEEWDTFNKQISELRDELDTNGTNSKMMNSVIHELSADYAELIQRKMEQKLKNVDLLIQNLNQEIPNPPSKSLYETDEEYSEAINVYTYQKFLYEKRQKEYELKTKLSEKRIEKIDKKLEEIRRLLFGVPVNS